MLSVGVSRGAVLLCCYAAVDQTTPSRSAGFDFVTLAHHPHAGSDASLSCVSGVSAALAAGWLHLI